jgi:hypothetical protein
MKIVIETIPHDQHRYPTVGDWFYDPDGTLHIKVSELSDWRHEALIAVHELVEVLCCRHRSVSQERVDEFDKQFEADREKQLKDPEIPEEAKCLIAISEPGDQIQAPYRTEHCFATGVERLLASFLDVPWGEYEAKLEALP